MGGGLRQAVRASASACASRTTASSRSRAASPDAVILRDMLVGGVLIELGCGFNPKWPRHQIYPAGSNSPGRAALRHRPRQAVRLHQEGDAELGRAAGAHGPRHVRQHGRGRRRRASSPTAFSKRCAIPRSSRWRRATAIRWTCSRAGPIDASCGARRARVRTSLGAARRARLTSTGCSPAATSPSPSASMRSRPRFASRAARRSACCHGRSSPRTAPPRSPARAH